jgi:cytochrome c
MPESRAAGDASAGRDVFKLCLECHLIEPGKNRIGPSLAGIVGRKAGIVENFRYSRSLQERGEAGLVWTPDVLKPYVIAPKDILPGGAMAFVGLKNVPKYRDDPQAAADDLIAFLATPK